MKEVQVSLNIKEDSDAVEKAKKSKIYYVSSNEIQPNKWNWIFDEQDSEEDMEELMNTIQESQLQVPLSVCKHSGNYVLLSGQRRLNALKRLLKNGSKVYFDGILISENSIPVIIKHECKTEREMFGAFTASNSQRHITKETHKNLIAEAIRLYNADLLNGIVEPGRTRDNIGRLAHVDGRTVQRYADIGKKGQLVKMKKEGQEKSPSDKLINKLTGIEKYFTNLDIDEIGDLSSFKSIAIPAISIMIQRLGIDPKEL